MINDKNISSNYLSDVNEISLKFPNGGRERIAFLTGVIHERL